MKIKISKSCIDVMWMIIIILSAGITKAISSSFFLIFDAILISFSIMVIVGRHRKVFNRGFRRLRIINCLLVIVFFMAVIYAVIRPNVVDSIWSIRILLYGIIYFYLGYGFSLSNNDKFVDMYLNGIVWILLVTAVYGWIEYIIGYNFLTPLFYIDYSGNKFLFQTMSVFVHPIVYACAMCEGFWINNYVNQSKKIRKNIINILFIGSILFSQARSAWISIIITGIIYICIVIFNRNGLIKLIQYIFISVLVLSLVAYFINSNVFFSNLYENILFRINSISGSNSQIQRLGAIYYIFTEMRKSMPWYILLGHGFGSSYDIMLKTTISLSNFSAVDNQYLALLYECGLVGLCFIAYIYVRLFEIFTLKIFTNKRMVFCSMSILSFLICCFFFEGISWLNVSSIVFIIGGIYASDMFHVRSEIY